GRGIWRVTSRRAGASGPAVLGGGALSAEVTAGTLVVWTRRSRSAVPSRPASGTAMLRAVEDRAREAAWISSAARECRDQGSLAMPWAITPSRAGGRSGRRSLTVGGGDITWACSVAASDGLGKGTSPVRHS